MQSIINRFAAIIGIVLAAACPSVLAQTTLIHAGLLIDGESDAPREAQSIVVEGNRIVSIEDGYIATGNADRFIDLSNATVMPGFIDTHVHISSEGSPDSYEEAFRLDPADYALRSTAYAERTLLAGFTTVRDLGTSDGVAISLRNAINQGWVDGPRIYTSGKSIATTGGHADPSNGRNRELTSDPGPVDGVINSVEDALKAVRARYKEGADLIKITVTGGVLSVASSGDNPQFTIEEVEAIVAAAEDYGFHVAAHAHGAEGMRRAVLGGVDSIEHGTYMTDEIMDLMKDRGTAYVPTLSAGRYVASMARVEGFYPAVVASKAIEIGPVADTTFARAYEAGVHIVFGTDTGVSPHGDNWKEFVYMVEGGMPPLEAINSATSLAADLLGVSATIGTLSAGKLADIVAVPGNPLEDIDLMGEVHFVMKDGVTYKTPLVRH
jgi:imidazolonepropionase-like amidohydrolase